MSEVSLGEGRAKIDIKKLESKFRIVYQKPTMPACYIDLTIELDRTGTPRVKEIQRSIGCSVYKDREIERAMSVSLVKLRGVLERLLREER